MNDQAKNQPSDIWAKLERSVLPASATAQEVSEARPSPEKQEADRKRRRRKIRTLDLFGWLFWIYAVLTLFIVDPARLILEAVSPGAVEILNYRIFLFLGVLIFLVYAFGRWAWVWTGYVLLFPFVVFVWKLPAFFVRRKSWPLFLGSVQAVFTAFADFKYNLFSKTLAAVCALIILLSHSRELIIVSATYIMALFLWSLVRLARKAFSSSAFLRVQRDKMVRILASERFQAALAPKEEWISTEVERYNENEANEVVMRIGLGIFVTKGMYFWAYQLDRYRRHYSPSLIFNGFSFIWLFFGAIFTFALVNYAAVKVEPTQFSGDTDPSFIAVLLYSLNALALSGGGGGIEAEGDLAYVIQLTAGIIGVVVLLSFILNVVVTFRRERDDTATRELVDELKQRAGDQEQRFVEDYSVTVDEARRRLETVGKGVSWLLGFLTASIPDEFIRGAESEHTNGPR